MTITADMFLAAADLERQLERRLAVAGSGGVECSAASCAGLILLGVLATMTALLFATASTSLTTTPPTGVPTTTSVTTDPPAPPWVLQLERDPLR